MFNNVLNGKKRLSRLPNAKCPFDKWGQCPVFLRG